MNAKAQLDWISVQTLPGIPYRLWLNLLSPVAMEIGALMLPTWAEMMGIEIIPNPTMEPGEALLMGAGPAKSVPLTLDVVMGRADITPPDHYGIRLVLGEVQS
jgi:hypothetical protein